MAIDLTVSPDSTSRGWASRLLGGLGGRKTRTDHPATAAPVSDPTRGKGFAALRPGNEIQAITRRLIAEDRYAFVLLLEAAESIDDRDASSAWEVLDRQMALVPDGIVPVVRAEGTLEPSEVAAFYLDRYSVTNRQFQRFVKAGCYDNLEIWPREIWPGVLKFTDRTGRPGPRHWENGTYPSDRADHPVVGVSWFEALAYARWVGKRLPAAAEWQKASGWPEHLSGGACSRYPWGDLFAEGKANLWSSGLGKTVAVDAFREGATLNGIYQLSGNVWEWLEDALEVIPCRSDQEFRPWKPMRRIIGGAFDTYLTGEATNQFVTGQSELDRRPNIGFRCAVSVSRLRPAGQPGSLPIRSKNR